MLHAEDTREDDERLDRAHLLQADEDIQRTQALTIDFGKRVRQRQRAGLALGLRRAASRSFGSLRE